MAGVTIVKERQWHPLLGADRRSETAVGACCHDGLARLELAADNRDRAVRTGATSRDIEDLKPASESPGIGPGCRQICAISARPACACRTALVAAAVGGAGEPAARGRLERAPRASASPATGTTSALVGGLMEH